MRGTCKAILGCCCEELLGNLEPSLIFETDIMEDRPDRTVGQTEVTAGGLW